MGRRDSYEPGTFCAVDVAVTDLDSAKRFYGELFGWDAEDVSAGGHGYTMLRLNGDAVAGMFEQPAESREAGAPPHWLSYVSVADVDESCARATELGGEVVLEPFEIEEVGRQAIIRDPTGATVCLWQPLGFAGATRINEPGSLTWNELATNDPAAALSFYSELFGWTSEEMRMGDGPAYNIIRVGERSNGGVRSLSPEEEQAGIPPYWVPYFAVESLDATFDRCGELGGAKVFGPIEFPAGRIGALRDPQGATFAIWEGEMED